MKSMFKRVVLVLLIAVSMSACVTAPKSQAFNREANTTLKRIQILPLQVKPVELVMFNNPANSFGLIGAADDYAKLTKRSHHGIPGRIRLLFEFGIASCAIAAYMYFIIKTSYDDEKLKKKEKLEEAKRLEEEEKLKMNGKE